MDAVATAKTAVRQARRLVGRAKRRLEGRSNSNPSRHQEPVIPTSMPGGTSILFLHHSTGWAVWNAGVPQWLDSYNDANGTDYRPVARAFPHWPHPWTNDPFDYWRLWVQHRGSNRHLDQETLAELAGVYDVIVWKHCFTAAKIDPDNGPGRASSRNKTLADYRAQYVALADAMRRYPDTTFIVWTVPPRAPGATSPQQAARATEFAHWVRDEWERPVNVHIFDYHGLAAPDGTLRADYPKAPGDSHPSRAFAEEAAPVLGQRIVDVIEGRA
ncbi:MAG: hypothetical protein Q4G51_12185 [Dermatophilus congolensis]|nr:hypothetical protein [Dermatophilus congolensis]